MAKKKTETKKTKADKIDTTKTEVQTNEVKDNLNINNKKENDNVLQAPKKKKVPLEDIIMKDGVLEQINFLEELPELKDTDAFRKSVMQNCFLFRLKREKPQHHILIKTLEGEFFLGQLISFDEYTLHVYVKDEGYESAMLFFKSGLSYIRVLSDAAYEHYLAKRKREKEQAKQKYEQYRTNKNSGNYNKQGNNKNYNNQNKRSDNNSLNRLAEKFKMAPQKKRRQEF